MHDPITRGPLMSGGIIEVLGGVERERVGRGVLKKKKSRVKHFPPRVRNDTKGEGMALLPIFLAVVGGEEENCSPN